MDEYEKEDFSVFPATVAGCPLLLIIFASIVRFLCREYVNWWYAIGSVVLLVVSGLDEIRFCRVILALLLAVESIASVWLSISTWTEVPFMGNICTATTPFEAVIGFIVGGYALFAVLSLLRVASSFLNSNTET